MLSPHVRVWDFLPSLLNRRLHEGSSPSDEAVGTSSAAWSQPGAAVCRREAEMGESGQQLCPTLSICSRRGRG